jgi:hypothetical protein
MAEEDKPAGTQVENLREMLPEEQALKPDLTKPRMPFNTSYVLTREQEEKLVTFAHERLTQLEQQLGRVGDSGIAGGRTGQPRRFLIPHPESFFGKRKKFSYRYYNHVDDRKHPNTIYETSNLTASLSQRITMQMIARAINFFFGQPDDIDWFSTEPVGVDNEAEADKIRKHSRWKVDQCGVKYGFIEGMEYAFVRGESIVKTTHQQRSQVYKRTATILMQDEKEPLLDAHGDYIIQGDTFVPEMQSIEAQSPGLVDRIKDFFGIGGPQPGAAETSEAPQQEQAEQEQPENQQTPTGRQVLKRDGVTVLPDVPIWKTQVITRQLITFEGPEAKVVYFEDFICPENATDIQTADLIAHLYDMDVMHVAQMFRGQFGEGDDAIKNMEAAVTRIREMSGESNLPKAAATQPRIDFKEYDTAGATAVPICQIAECYLTYDADGDGVQEEIMLVMDRLHMAPIYYEYLANVTVRGDRPFQVWRPMPVDQRWYGMGSMELFDPEQEFIDLEINRYNFGNSRAGRIDWWNPAATVEGSRDPHMRLNHGMTYTLRDGKKKEDAYDYSQVPLADPKALEYLLNLFMQLMQTKSGVVNSADQNLSGLPSNKLATGINEIQQSGEELYNRMVSHLFRGVKSSLRAIVDIIYANLNRTEVFNYFEGDANEILTLEPQDVRDLALNVTLELSRTQKAKAMEMGQAAQELIQWYYSMSPDLQDRLSDYARQQLKALGVSQADKVIEPVEQHGSMAPQDKPSAVATALAQLMKSGANVTPDDINTALQKMGLPPINTNGQNSDVGQQQPPAAAIPGAGAGPSPAPASQPAQSVV